MIEFEVIEKPPYKQSYASRNEQTNQEIYKESLKNEARNLMITKSIQMITKENVKLMIRYERANGRMDSANIIGGIADTLEGIVFVNDNQIKEIHYIENKGDKDKYKVKIEV